MLDKSPVEHSEMRSSEEMMGFDNELLINMGLDPNAVDAANQLVQVNELRQSLVECTESLDAGKAPTLGATQSQDKFFS